MATSNNQNDFLKSVERILSKSADANRQMLEDSVKMAKQVLSGKTKLTDNLNADDLGKTMSDWLQLNLRYTETMIDLGVSWSKSVAELFQPKAAATPAPEAETATDSKEAAPPPPTERHEIVMAGNAGETIATSLQLKSSLPGIQKCSFEATKFREEGTGKFAAILLSFDPAQFEISDGESVSATLTVAVPEKLQPSTYRSQVVVHGFENTTFDLVVQTNHPAAPAPSAPKKAVTKKAVPKKKAPNKKQTG